MHRLKPFALACTGCASYRDEHGHAELAEVIDFDGRIAAELETIDDALAAERLRIRDLRDLTETDESVRDQLIAFGEVYRERK